MDLQVTGGADDLERVAKALKDAGATDLKKEMARGLREQGKPIISDIKDSARAHLPRRGGLADTIAGSKFSTKSRLTGSRAGVRIEGASPHDLGALDRGILRHPVYGNRSVWKTQSLRTGFFTDPVQRRAPQLRNGMQRVLQDVADKIERHV